MKKKKAKKMKKERNQNMKKNMHMEMNIMMKKEISSGGKKVLNGTGIIKKIRKLMKEVI